MLRFVPNEALAYELIKSALSDVSASQKTITMRKEDTFFAVSYENDEYCIEDNIVERDICQLFTVCYDGSGDWVFGRVTKRTILPKEEVTREIFLDLHHLFMDGYTLEIDNRVYKLKFE